jgi:hypothetical protein
MWDTWFVSLLAVVVVVLLLVVGKDTDYWDDE